MKKTGVAMFIFALFITMTLGCQKVQLGYSAQNPVTVTLWHYYNGIAKATFDEMVQDFNATLGKEKGIIIDSYTHGGVTELANAVMASANDDVGASDMPNIFSTYSDTAYRIEQMDLLVNLEDYFNEESLQTYRAEFIEEGRFRADAPVKILPIAKSMEAIFINDTDFQKFAQASGSSVDEFHTWESLADLAKKYYQWTDRQTPALNDGKALFGLDSMANFFLVSALQLGKACYSFDEQGAYLHFAKETAKRIWDNYYTPFVSGYYAAIGRFRSDDAKVGDVLAYIGSTAGSNYFPSKIELSKDSSYPIDCVVLPYPSYRGATSAVICQGAGMSIAKSDFAHEHAAALFLDWFTQASTNVDFAIPIGYLPVKTEALLVDTAMKKMEEISMTAPAVLQSTQSAYQMLNSYVLFENKPFEGSFEVRKIMDYSLLQCARDAKEQINLAVQEGQNREDVLAQWTDEAHFQSWYEQFTSQCRKIIPVIG